MNNPTVLFFSRSFYAKFFPKLKSQHYKSIHATLTKEEKEIVIKEGGEVCGCFEEEFEQLTPINIPDNYLLTSMASDRFLINRTLEERNHVLSKEISFWKGIINKYKPNIIVNETVAIEISEVLYIESKLAGIPYYSFLAGILKETTIWKPDAMDGSLREVANLDTKFDASTIEKATDYFLKKKANKDKPYYILQHIGENRFSLKKLRKALISDCERIIYYIRRKYFNNGIFRYENIKRNMFEFLGRYICSVFYKYDKIEMLDKVSYVFYPLHMEPEATLNYFSEFFSDQPSNIRNIAKCLKTNQILVVKEHPQQFGMLLTKRFRKLKEVIPNIVYLPAELPSETVINSCEAIVTLTSSAAWEGIIHGKPVVMLGKIYYDNYPLLKKASSFDELRTIIRENKYLYPVDEITIKFISYLIEKHTEMGIPYPHPVDFDEKNIANVISVVEKRLLML